MASITAQRDLVNTLKKETLLNVGILSKLQPMPKDLSRQIFKEEALEKPTQSVFNHLSYYLVSIIDSQRSSVLPWPLYDTKTERAYRNEFSNFLSEYSANSLLSPVMSSYLVNPGCYKVKVLIFQLSQLAVHRMLKSKMHREHQKKLYTNMTEKYKSENKDGFIENIETETDVMMSKFSNYLLKREVMERIAEVLRRKITQMEDTLDKTNAKSFVNEIIDEFLKQNVVKDESKTEFLKIKNVHKTSQVFDSWLEYLDEQLNTLESQWILKTASFLESSSKTLQSTEDLIKRQTGEADKCSFMLEFNQKTDEINTNELQNNVNSEQKYVLKNLIKDEKLMFPNLVRSYVISICYILSNTEISDEIYKFNEYLEGGRRNYEELVSAMKSINGRVFDAESKLQVTQLSFNQSLLPMDISEIPPLPDLSDIRTNRDTQQQVIFDMFTPLSTTRHQFNLHRKHSLGNFLKPQSKPLATPFHHGPRDSFLKSLRSCRVRTCDQSNVSQNLHNMSTISQVSHRGNETIAECSAGFTKQQILRLLSTKKTSSSKKFKYKQNRPDINVKKGGLFNESNVSNESNGSNGLFRSYSSPNLFENKDKRSQSKGRAKNLSIMMEDIPTLLEVSGISLLDKDSKNGTPNGGNLESTRNSCNMSSLPLINIKADAETRMTNILQELDQINSPLYNLESTRNSSNTSDVPAIPVINVDKANIFSDFNNSSPHVIGSPKLSRKPVSRLPVKTKLDLSKTTAVSSELETKVHGERELNNFEITAPVLQERRSLDNKIVKPVTPQLIHPIRKTSSIEKIINRFKKVRASILPMEREITEVNDIKTIDEEKENLNRIDVEVFSANRVLLPDLLSPSCSMLTIKSTDYLDELCFEMDKNECRKPRESLGTALGVDQTFLDQFDLID